jgi:hypothetical protein
MCVLMPDITLASRSVRFKCQSAIEGIEQATPRAPSWSERPTSPGSAGVAPTGQLAGETPAVPGGICLPRSLHQNVNSFLRSSLAVFEVFVVIFLSQAKQSQHEALAFQARVFN